MSIAKQLATKLDEIGKQITLLTLVVGEEEPVSFHERDRFIRFVKKQGFKYIGIIYDKASPYYGLPKFDGIIGPSNNGPGRVKYVTIPRGTKIAR